VTDEHTPMSEPTTEAPAAPRRRRRATSPAGNPTATVSVTESSSGSAATPEPTQPAVTPSVAVVADEPSAPATRGRGRRRATAPESEPSAAGTQVVEEAPAVEESATTAVKAPSARGGRRRTTSRSAADGAAPGDAAAQSDAETSDTTAKAAETSDAASTADAAKGAPRKKRPPRSSAATAVAEIEVADAADDAATDGATGTDEAAPAPRRRRATSTRTRRAVVEAEPVAEVEPEEEDVAAEATTASSTGLDVIAELGAPIEQPEKSDERPRFATTAVLFQAPDPATRTRRRRAQAPAGPPQENDEVAAPTVPADAGSDGTADDSAAETAAEESAPRTGRSRSGRRRGRGADAAEDGPVQDMLDVSDAQEGDAPVDTDTDAEDEGDETADMTDGGTARRRRRRGGRGRRRSGSGDEQDGTDPTSGNDETGDSDADDSTEGTDDGQEGDESEDGSSSRRRRRRSRSRSGRSEGVAEESARGRGRSTRGSDEVTALKGSTRLEAKRQRRREGRDAGRRRSIITESEFLARREAVTRSMVVKEANGRVQIAVLEDDVLVEHFVSRSAQNGQSSLSGNVYLGRVQNVLPSMEAAFVDIGKGRNAVLYAGEVNWDAAGLEGQPRRIEQALKSGDPVLVQVTKDPIGHKGARLTSQITLAGRYLVYVPGGGMTGISRKLPENERARLKKLLKEIVPEAAGVIVRTAAEGASEDELRRDVQRLQDQWVAIEKKMKTGQAPVMLQGEPDLAIRVVRDIFNDDFSSLVVQGDGAWSMISEYVDAMAPDLAEKVSRWDGTGDVFAAHRVDEQLAKGMDRKVWLPSGGSLVIDRTEAMTVVDVNTGKFTGSGGTLEETVTRNNLEAAEEIVRQLRLRDIGGIIVIDFIDMVLESNRDLVLRRLVECLGRDRTKHQVAEVTSLGLVQMTRKRVGQGLVEAFSETCQHCAGRGFIVHTEPIDARQSEQTDGAPSDGQSGSGESKRSRRRKTAPTAPAATVPVLPEARDAVKATLATIAAAAAHAHEHDHDGDHHPFRGADHDGEPQSSPGTESVTGSGVDATAASAAELGDGAAGDTPVEGGAEGALEEPSSVPASSVDVSPSDGEADGQS